MKFLCDNCNAKYQIPDEKIVGRTLRMKCRKCEHDIIIRGEGADRPKTVAPGAVASIPASMMPSSASALPMARSRTSGTGVPPRASATSLGADAERRRSGEIPALPSEPVELWHVAINDVPVGPIRRDELAKKVGSGEVTGESLCWREGFDDWRPVREVKELASLLDQKRPPALRPAEPAVALAPEPSLPAIDLSAMRSSAFSLGDQDDDEATIVGASPLLREMQEREAREREEREAKQRAALAAARSKPATETKVETASSRDSRSEARPARDSRAEPRPAPVAPAPEPRVDAKPVETKPVETKPVAIEPAHVAKPEPLTAPITTPGTAVPAASSVVARPSAPDSLMPKARRRQVPPTVWIAAAGALGFGMMMAYLVAERMLAPQQPVAQQPTTQPTAAPEVTAPAARTDLDVAGEEAVADPSQVAAAADPAAARPTGAAPHASAQPTSPQGTRTPTAQASGTPAPTAPLTAEQRALMERMGASDSERAPASNIQVPTTAQSAGAAHGPLSATDLAAVVNRNKIQLQRCHERALRGMSVAPAVRMDVSLRVSAAGTVTTASAAGTDFGGLKACIEQTVRRWRFPESTSGGETRFPVVFQAIN